MGKSRIESIDLAKGITILLVIIGHTISDGYVKVLIYSFHMPLFFILSGWTSKYSISAENYILKTLKSFRHLMIPALIILIVKSIPLLYNNSFYAYNSLANWGFHKILMIVWADVDYYTIPILNITTEGVGIVWFFYVLWGGGRLYDAIQMKVKNSYALFVVILTMTICGYYIGQYLHLPFSFDISLTILFFLFIGDKLKRYDPKNIWYFLCSLCLFILLFYVCYSCNDEYVRLDIAKRRYPLCLLGYLCGVAGTLAVVGISEYITKTKIGKALSFVGRYSLYLLIIHSLDRLFEPVWDVFNDDIAKVGVRISIDVSLFMIYCLMTNKIKLQRS